MNERGELPGWSHRGWLGLLTLLLIGSRFVALTADPPRDMSLNYVTDEGWWAHNARQHAVFGRWMIDDHNLGLIWAPLYTGTLRVIYQLAGWGLWQTRSLAALSGVVTCLIVYGFVNMSHGRRAAVFAAWLLGTNYLWLTYNRVAFVESFQTAFVALAYLAVAASVRQRGWAVVAGIALALAALAKISAITSVAGIGAFWIWQLVWPPQSSAGRSQRIVTLTGASLFSLALALVALAVWLLLIQPHRHEFAVATRHLVGLASSRSSYLGLFTLGLQHTTPRVTTSMFVVHAAWLLGGVVLVAIRQLARPRQPLDATNRLCWCWLVFGLAAIGQKDFDSDRRYLSVLPPLAILVGIELAESGLTVISRDDLAGRASRWRRGACVSLVAIVIGFMMRAELSNYLLHIGRTWSVGYRAGLSASGAAGLAWIGMAALAAPVLYWAAYWLPARPRQLPAWVVLWMLLAVDLTKSGLYVSQLTYLMPHAARQLDEIGQRLPPESRVVLGDNADTLGLGTDFFTFIIRNWKHNQSFMNLDGWERFPPGIVLSDAVPTGFLHVTDLMIAPPRPADRRTVIPVYVRQTLADSAATVQERRPDDH